MSNKPTCQRLVFNAAFDHGISKWIKPQKNVAIQLHKIAVHETSNTILCNGENVFDHMVSGVPYHPVTSKVVQTKK